MNDLPRADADRDASTAELRELLGDLDRDPRELIELLRAGRERVVDDAVLARDLARAELEFLLRSVASRRYGDDVAASVADARVAAQIAEFEYLRNEPVAAPAALFDLAELSAHVSLEADPQRYAAVCAELGSRVAQLDRLPPALLEEASERYVALSTEEEDRDLQLRIAMLRETGALIAKLGERFGERALQKLARRLARAHCDRVLAARLERALTRRGAVLLENASMVGLLVVFVLLLIDMTVDLTPSTRETLFLIDASVCAFFIGEFVFKLSLAPARSSWFLRNVLTDLLPAIPAALWFFAPTPLPGQDAAALRAAKVLRVTWLARYVQAMRPLLRLVRLLLFMAKGMDALVQRFSPLLNRNFVFFEEPALVRRVAVPGAGGAPIHDVRALTFRALRREQLLVRELDASEARQVLCDRATRLAGSLRGLPVPAVPAHGRAQSGPRIGFDREVPVEHAIEALYALRPEELPTWLPRHDIDAIDRVVRIVNAPLIRQLPIVRWFRIDALLAGTSEARVVAFARRIAALLERWRERALYVADLHGIVTGPQILDRLATAMVKASFRPARNLILFGLFFVLVRLLVGPGTAIGQFLSKFVATPVLVLGIVCAVVLALGYWLKRIAGEAADQFQLTTEASFIGLLELVNRRTQDEDVEFLASRVFRWDLEPWQAAAWMTQYVRAARVGRTTTPIVAPPRLEDELYRTALLYLNFLNGAMLHATDVKMTDQLLANLSLENIRGEYLRYDRRQRRRLRKLSLQGGALIGGPYMWFRCITESVALETAKRVIDYNRNCLTKAQRAVATPAQRAAFARWMRLHNRKERGRLERVDAVSEDPYFVTTEFNALDFLSVDPIREAHVARLFGPRVLKILQAERQAMVREIFGMRPLHERPRVERTLNFYSFYMGRLSRGRVFLAPLHVVWLMGRTLRMSVQKTVEIVREILAPEAARADRVSGRAPFAVALRKLRRMKAPTLLEAMRLRVAFDPAYCGAPPGWSSHHGLDEHPELERDMDFLGMHERDRAEMRDAARRCRERVEELHHFVRRHGERGLSDADEDLARRGECAVTIAYVTDRDDLRTLARAEQWFERELVRMEAPETELSARAIRRALAFVWRGFAPHPIDVWLRSRTGSRPISSRARTNFKRAWQRGEPELRATVRAWNALPRGVGPELAALDRARAVYRSRDAATRELAALRAVQSLSVLEIRNYRRLVFDLGGYAADGESRAAAEALP